jgi:light-regulated signal transduction histidine kinase (bacteriophytochrome)
VNANVSLGDSTEVTRSLFQNIVEHASDGILVVDTDGYVKLCNPAVEKLFQRQRHEFQGELFGFPVVDGESTEISILRADGSVAIADMRVSEAHFENERVYIAMLRDVTERKLADQELKRSNAELEQFSYAISHDMRQPLRMISSYLQLIEMGLAGQLDSEQREYFHFAIDGAKRLDQMLTGLLDYSRVGRKGEPRTWIESSAILDEVLLFLRPALAEVQADLRILGDWPRILVNPDEILRLLQNLIGNAIKFRIDGCMPVVELTSATVGKEWRVTVADNGVGIIPDQIGRLFQVFQRLHSRSAYEGTGIGLALCRKIAEHHGGRIWVESPGLEQGSRFCVALPLLPNQAPVLRSL